MVRDVVRDMAWVQCVVLACAGSAPGDALLGRSVNNENNHLQGNYPGNGNNRLFPAAPGSDHDDWQPHYDWLRLA